MTLARRIGGRGAMAGGGVLRISSPKIGREERARVNACLDRGELSWRGEEVAGLEADLAGLYMARRATATSSGTTALQAALAAMGVERGDQVVVPALTYVATAAVVEHLGASPVFCDVDPLTWTMDPARLKATLRATGAGFAVPVHLYGVPADMGPVMEVATALGVSVLEDAAESHGAWYRGARVWGHAAATSFFANKLVAAGEGGAVITNDDALDTRVRLLRGQGQPEDGPPYWHEVVGHNWRLGALAAAVARAQVESLAERVAHHAWLEERYRGRLFGTVTFQRHPPDSTPSPWLVAVLLPEGSPDVATVRGRMLEAGVETRPFFAPPYLMPAFCGRAHGDCPVAEGLWARGLCLPTHSEMDALDIEAASVALEGALR